MYAWCQGVSAVSSKRSGKECIRIILRRQSVLQANVGNRFGYNHSLGGSCQ